MIDSTSTRADTRARIVEVASRLLDEHGSAAVTTRGVALAAGVQAPTIYRLFGDKDGLLEAVAEHVMDTLVSTKAAVVAAATAGGVDPLVDLAEGWRTQIDFGLANPHLFRLLNDPSRPTRSAALDAGRRVLAARIHRVAETGRLRVSEQRAVGLVQAAGTGAILTILATAPAERDPGIADELYAAVLRQILTDAPERDGSDGGDTVAVAVAMRALVPTLEMLSSPERSLMEEWLDRAIEGFPR